MDWLSHIWKKPFLHAVQVPYSRDSLVSNGLDAYARGTEYQQGRELTVVAAVPACPDAVSDLPPLYTLTNSRHGANYLVTGRNRTGLTVSFAIACVTLDLDMLL